MDLIAPFINQAMADILVASYKEERMTQADLVARTGINPTTMQRLLAGKSVIDVTQLAALADAIGVPPQDLMERAVERAERLSAASSNMSDLQKKRSEKEAEARAMTPDQLAQVEKRAATDDPELGTDEPEAP